MRKIQKGKAKMKKEDMKKDKNERRHKIFDV